MQAETRVLEQWQRGQVKSGRFDGTSRSTGSESVLRSDCKQSVSDSMAEEEHVDVRAVCRRGENGIGEYRSWRSCRMVVNTNEFAASSSAAWKSEISGAKGSSFVKVVKVVVKRAPGNAQLFPADVRAVEMKG
jgi:hypothetical protein